MKYFTPELFRAANSSDMDLALDASDQWEAAAKSYRRRLKSIKKKLPAGLNLFLDTIDLHDAEICGLNLQVSDAEVLGLNVQKATLFAKIREGIVVLSYQLDSTPVIEYDQLPASLVSLPRLWLYDEFDILEGNLSPNRVTHEIFLSDGVLIQFRFTDFAFKMFPTALSDPRCSPAVDQRERLVSV